MTESDSQITVEQLLEQYGDRLELTCVSGKSGLRRIIKPETGYKPPAQDAETEHVEEAVLERSVVGYLNLIHPHQIQIIGGVELKYIDSLRDITRHDAIKQLFKHEPACIIISDDQRAPAFLKRKCDDHQVPLIISPVASTKLTESLHYYLATLFAEIITVHGVFMEIMAIGVLITGPSGIGKSELALELITRGHRLVADDAPQFSRLAPDIINGTCPDSLRDFLEVRGLGIINIRRLYGNTAIKNSKYLRLIVRLEPLDKQQMQSIDRLEGSYRSRTILETDIPEITIPVAPGRNLAVLLECAARNHSLRMSGYNASQEFINNQQHIIEQSSGG
jgi:HPr kinase/phosphorylase